VRHICAHTYTHTTHTHAHAHAHANTDVSKRTGLRVDLTPSPERECLWLSSHTDRNSDKSGPSKRTHALFYPHTHRSRRSRKIFRYGRKPTMVGVGVSSVGMTPFELMPSRE
jgi:hypothetical protein